MCIRDRAYISERFLTRKNGVRGYVEVASKKKRNGQKPVFKPVTDYWVNSLWRSLLKDGHYCSHNDIRAILMSDFSETFHPFRAYFEGLAPWDGVTDWIGQLADTVDTTRPVSYTHLDAALVQLHVLHHVRGGATDQNLILFNDGTVYNPTHLFGFFSVFNPDVVKDMELYKSSIPAKYGGRISSVLDINSREGNKMEFKGSASIGLLTSRLTLEGPLFSEKTSFIVGGRTTYSDWILKKLPEKSGYKDGNAGFYDLNATINHKFDERNNLYLNGYYSHDRFRFNVDERYAYENANASVKWRHRCV